MKAHAAREILRDRTAYRVGRTLANVLLVIMLVGNVGLVILAASVPDYAYAPREAAVIVATVASILSSLFWILVWEIVHALFDRSDAALSQLTVEGILGV